MTEDPIIYHLPDGGTIVSAVLCSSSIEVLTEVEAYPFVTLVSDCGGVLGLFIGFNFLMVIDPFFSQIVKHDKCTGERTSRREV